MPTSYEQSKGAFDRLHAHFGRNPRRDSYPAWHRKIEHIPAEALEAAVERIEDECQSLPANLTRAIRDGWLVWQSANPGRVVRETTACRACDGRGELMFEAIHQAAQQAYRHVCRCGHCRNWIGRLGDDVPMMTMQQVRDRGGTICERYPGELREMGRPSAAIKNDIAGMVANLGGM